jgi:hypothetical protein
MGKHRSGSARRRARRLAELEASLRDERFRASDGGLVIDIAVGAMEAVRMLAAAAYDKQLELKGNELADLLSLLGEEIKLGRDLQKV